MKRTTIMLSDDTAARVEHEARRRGVSVAAVVREAVERHLQPPQARRLPFVGIGEGALADDASERVDAIVLEAMKKRGAAG